MLKNKDLSEISEQNFKQVFFETFEMIYECLGQSAFQYKKKLNRAFYETLSLIVSEHLRDLDCEKLKGFHKRLIQSKEFETLSKSSTTNVGNFLRRLNLARDFLSL